MKYNQEFLEIHYFHPLCSPGKYPEVITLTYQRNYVHQLEMVLFNEVKGMILLTASKTLQQITRIITREQISCLLYRAVSLKIIQTFYSMGFQISI